MREKLLRSGVEDIHRFKQKKLKRKKKVEGKNKMPLPYVR
jgi:hypothetical protein